MAKAKTALANLIDIQKDELETAGVKIDVIENTSVLDRKTVVIPNYNEKSTQNQKKAIYETLEEYKVAYVPTEACYRWEFSNRPDDEMGDIDELTESIKNQGQKIPVMLRRGKGGKFELIYGCRRWTACKRAGVRLLALIKENMSDKEASLLQEEENLSRNNISEYARAKNFKLKLDRGLYESEKELGENLGLKPQTFNDIMAYTRVPQELEILIPWFKDISRKTAVKLASLSKNKSNLKPLKKLAKAIGSKKIHAENIDFYLNNPTQEKEKRKTVSVCNKKNELLFQLKYSNDKLNIIIKNIDENRVNIISEQLKSVLEEGDNHD